MAKTCPVTNGTVLYIDCLDCEEKDQCKGTDERPTFALLVVGSRSITDYAFVKEKLDKMLCEMKKSHRILIVSGGAKGADSLAERYARESGFDLKVMPAEWDKYKKAAGYLRNSDMHRFIAGFPDRGCVAFWDGSSKGTLHSLQLARKYDNPLRFIDMSGKRDLCMKKRV